MIHPTAHSPRRGDPGGAARRAQSGVPTVRVVHGGVQYREYLNEEQRSQARGPQRGSRVGVEEGCSAGRMQLEFHHGLLRLRPMRRIADACAVATLIGALLVVSVRGQSQPPPRPSEDQGFRFKTGVELINVTATVS